MNEWKNEQVGNRRKRIPAGALRDLDNMLREHALEGSDIVNHPYGSNEQSIICSYSMRQELLDA